MRLRCGDDGNETCDELNSLECVMFNNSSVVEAFHELLLRLNFINL